MSSSSVNVAKIFFAEVVMACYLLLACSNVKLVLRWRGPPETPKITVGLGFTSLK